MNKKVLVTVILFGSLTVSGIVSAQSVYPGQHQGKLKKETVAPLQAESFDLKDDRYFDGVVSEVRIWNRALTAEEIQATNHFYTIEPESEGLIAYWKFDEGSGTVAKDYSVSGYDLTIEKEPKWESVSLPQ